MSNAPLQANNLRDTLFLAIRQCESLQQFLLQDPYSELDAKQLEPKLASLEHLLKQAFESYSAEHPTKAEQTCNRLNNLQEENS